MSKALSGHLCSTELDQHGQVLIRLVVKRSLFGLLTQFMQARIIRPGIWSYSKPRAMSWASYSIMTLILRTVLVAVLFILESHRRRSEEHTSELQSRFDLVGRLLLDKKKKPKLTRQ